MNKGEVRSALCCLYLEDSWHVIVECSAVAAQARETFLGPFTAEGNWRVDSMRSFVLHPPPHPRAARALGVAWESGGEDEKKEEKGADIKTEENKEIT